MRILRSGSDDITDAVVRQEADGWHINWSEVPAAQILFSLNLCHDAFTRKRGYPTQEAAAQALSECMSLRIERQSLEV